IRSAREKDSGQSHTKPGNEVLDRDSRSLPHASAWLRLANQARRSQSLPRGKRSLRRDASRLGQGVPSLRKEQGTCTGRSDRCRHSGARKPLRTEGKPEEARPKVHREERSVENAGNRTASPHRE